MWFSVASQSAQVSKTQRWSAKVGTGAQVPALTLATTF
jgi:hypothetical protein